LCVAFVNILPPLYDLAVNLTDNFGIWAEKRKAEVLEAAGLTDVASPQQQLDESGTPRSVVESNVMPLDQRKSRRKSFFSYKAETYASPASPLPASPEHEECRKLDDRVRAFRDKVTALKLPEASRSRGKRTSLSTEDDK
jgi:hypothetical protein